MKKKLLFLYFISTGLFYAQVGVGTKTPQSKLEVNGDIKLGNELKSNEDGQAGMLRWNTKNKCFEGHDAQAWRCLGYEFFPAKSQEPLITASGVNEIMYDNGSGWTDKDEKNDSFKNIIIFSQTKGRGDIYNPITGTFTIDQEGLYKISYQATLLLSYPNGTFDGTSGEFISWLTLKDEVVGNKIKTFVYRGRKRKSGGGLTYKNNDSQIVYLKKGDVLHLRFTTNDIDSMDQQVNNIYLSMKDSWVSFWKL